MVVLVTVLLVVLMVSSHVMMVLAYQVVGNVMYLGVTVLVELVKMKPIVAQLNVQTVHMIGRLTDLNAVIQQPVSMV